MFDKHANTEEQGNRAQKLFAAVVLAALDDAIDDNRKYKSDRGTQDIASWARSNWGQFILRNAGIEPSQRVVDNLQRFVNQGVRTSIALSREESERRRVMVSS